MNSFVRPEIICKRMTPLLGTFVRIELRSSQVDRDELNALAGAAFDRISRVQKKMSFFEDESDVCRFNRCKVGDSIEADAETLSVLEFAETLRVKSAGIFNVAKRGAAVYQITSNENGFSLLKIRDGKIDLGGVAKGYAVDAAVSEIQSHLHAKEIFGSVNAGGDVRVFESHEKPLPFRIPRGESSEYRVLSVKEGAMATSSVRPEVDHYDSRSGQRLEKGGTATVLAPSAMHADALTKLVILSENFAFSEITQSCLKLYSAQGFYEVH